MFICIGIFVLVKQLLKWSTGFERTVMMGAHLRHYMKRVFRGIAS